jgi:hypothetical protein
MTKPVAKAEMALSAGFVIIKNVMAIAAKIYISGGAI